MIGPVIFMSSAWVDAIGWMLLHSIWQGAGVAAALSLALYVLRSAPARTRYLAACAAMILFAVPPISTLVCSGVPHPTPPIHHEAASGPAIVASLRVESASPPGAADPRFADRLVPMLPSIVALWMAGVGVFALRLLGGCVQARRWVRHHTRPLDDPWPARVERLKERLGVHRAVELLESAWVEVPMVVGWLRPAILVPVAALSGLSVAELESILAHELAHIRRHDYLVNLVQCVVEVMLFYHPAAWWISHAIRRERESCCDDLAVAIGCDRVVYARALAAMEGLRVPAFSPSPAAIGGLLFARVRRILKPQEESMNPVRILAGLAIVLAAAPLWLTRADDAPPASPTTVKTPTPPTHDGSFPEVPVVEERVPRERQDPFPNRSFADVISSVEQAPSCRFIVNASFQPLQPPTRQTPRRVAAVLDEGTVATMPDTPETCLDPPTEAEVWAKVSKSKPHTAFAHVQRRNVRIAVEKIGGKVDPVKIYPLAGPCQLVHCHYKCTVRFDEISDSDDPIPFHHVDHRVEVVYIDKDHLRRAQPVPVAVDPVDHRLDRLAREIEELKSTRQRDRREQEQVLDRLIGELEGLKRALRDDSKDTGAAPPSRIR